MSTTIPTDGASSITVAVRVRPFTINEAAQLRKCDDGPLFLGDGSLAAAPSQKITQRGIKSIIKVVDEKCLIFDPPEDSPVQKFSRGLIPSGKRVKDQTFGFDKVFDDNTTQSEVYEATTKGLLDSVMDGYNATVFAYGATGCGKTHTITGTAQQPGIIFLTMQELFERIGEMQEERVTEVSLSYLEIYNETIRDLLVPGTTKQGLMLREDANQAVSVAGLSSHHPQNVQEVMDMLIRGNAARTQSPTDANATSSRSHAVLQINVAQKERNAAISEPTTMATLSIIDLAGSERASATRNRGERLLEGANINKSLLALGSCINALCDPRKKNHVPYRNSKLTRLLKFSLGGNCKTVMIVCVSPSSVHFDETQNTLRYANRAKNIQTKVVRNVYNVDRHVKDYLKKIDEQMARINELQAQQKDHEAHAMAKFRKLEDKRQAIAKESVARIRAAYENSAEERQERTNNMKRLRHVEKRIGLIQSWVSSFDQVCETRDNEEPPRALAAMRQTAQGILAELEGSRQHYHQRLARNNWERGITTALQNGIRSLQDSDPSVGQDPAEAASLKREVELLKSSADREAFTSVLDQEKTGEQALVQVLLQAHFETVAILSQIFSMDEADAVKAAKGVLGKLCQSCTEATGQIIRPDGGLQITQPVPPSKTGTPRKRKVVDLRGPSPMKAKLKHSLLGAGDSEDSPASSLAGKAGVSPGVRASPMIRRKMGGGARRGIAMVGSPRKRMSPAKPGAKRGVRWRDDAEEGASLADYQATPIKLDSTPDTIPTPLPTAMNAESADGEDDSPTPMTGAPVFSIQEDEDIDSQLPPTFSRTSQAALAENKPKPSRFDNSFLKRTDFSPNTRQSLVHHTSTSPLQEIQGNATKTRSPLSKLDSPPSDPSLSSNENEDHDTTSSGSSAEEDATKLLKAHKSLAPSNQRRSSVRRVSGGVNKRQSSLSTSAKEAKLRRRSPNASSPPPAEGIFSASHARRMVKGPEREEAHKSALSPRPSHPALKSSASAALRDLAGERGGVRRTTFNVDTAASTLAAAREGWTTKGSSGGTTGLLGGIPPGRMSLAGTSVSAAAGRGGGSKAAWR